MVWSNRRGTLLGAISVGLLTSALAGCGTDAVGTDACRKIEQARCSRAPMCPDLDIQGEVALEQCLQFARDRCLHGLAVPDPGPTVVDTCVAAISTTASCQVVLAPETTPACAFLSPVPAPDAALEATSEAVPDASSDSAEGGQSGD
jgi:hypothetical protein